jgi:peptidoglycan hydrolase-like protein with peptidoglycan-binding domain
MKEVVDTQNAAAAEEARRPNFSHRNLQQRLKDLGYLPENAIIDGIYGTGTRSAIRNFQQANNIIIDGFMSDATQRALMNNSRPLSQSATSPPIPGGPAASGVSAPSAAGRPTNSPAASPAAGNQAASGSLSLWWILLLIPAVWVMLRLLAGTKKISQYQSESIPNENSYEPSQQNRNNKIYEMGKSSYVTQIYEKQSNEKEIYNPWSNRERDDQEIIDKKEHENNKLNIDKYTDVSRRKCSSCGSKSFEEKRTSAGAAYFSCQFCGVSVE